MNSSDVEGGSVMMTRKPSIPKSSVLSTLVILFFLIVLLTPLATFAVSSTAIQGCQAPLDYFDVSNGSSCVMVYTFDGDPNWVSATADVQGGGWQICSISMGSGLPCFWPGDGGSARANFNTSGLTPGTYNGTITINTTPWGGGQCSSGSSTVDATLTITPPIFTVEPAELIFDRSQSCSLSSQTFTVANNEPPELCSGKFYYIADDQTWLTETGRLYIEPGETGTATVNVNTYYLPPGTNTGVITVTSGSRTETVTVTVLPPGPEICDGVDNDCNGQIDDNPITFDNDNDSYQNYNSSCEPIDCNDSDPLIHPGAQEICDGKDNDCNVIIDDNPVLFDNDNDGYLDYDSSCVPVDCNDADPLIHPDAQEVCDGKDNDCDGEIDETTQPVRIDGPTPVYYSSLQDAYNAAADGDVVQVQAVELIEDLNAQFAISVTLDGGYNCDYTSKTGMTVLIGNIHTSNGTVTTRDFHLVQ